jgi:hypothetical protein
MLIARQYDPLLLSMWLRMTQYLTSTWKRMTMVRFILIYSTLSSLLLWTELEPRRQRDEKVELFVDLAATREDHEEVISTLFLISLHKLIENAVS